MRRIGMTRVSVRGRCGIGGVVYAFVNEVCAKYGSRKRNHPTLDSHLPISVAGCLDRPAVNSGAYRRSIFKINPTVGYTQRDVIFFHPCLNLDDGFDVQRPIIPDGYPGLEINFSFKVF